MLYITAESQIYLSVHTVDFRKQIDGLIKICEEDLHHDPRNGNFYLFINRNRTMIRILHYDKTGYWLATKRLSKGKYTNWPKSTDDICNLKAYELTKLLQNSVASR